MHREAYKKLIENAAKVLRINVDHIAGDSIIQLSKDDNVQYIVGVTFPLNSAAFYKIAGNKNLCSDVLTNNSVANIPHHVIFSPEVLKRRNNTKGNFVVIQHLIEEHGFPIIIKKNNSSKGEGVFIAYDETELEDIVSKLYATEIALCLSPFRKDGREFRAIVLDGYCMVCYEKKIPVLFGDGTFSIGEILTRFITAHKNDTINPEKYFEPGLLARLAEIPQKNEPIKLQWRHNRFLGTLYELSQDPRIQKLAVQAAKATGARFASVDVIFTAKYGFEILEMSPSVFVHFPIYDPTDMAEIKVQNDIFQAALKSLFEIN